MGLYTCKSIRLLRVKPSSFQSSAFCTSEHCLFNLHSSKPIWCTISPLSHSANGCTPPFISSCAPAVLPCRSAACLLCCCSAFLQYCPTNDIFFPRLKKPSNHKSNPKCFSGDHMPAKAQLNTKVKLQ